MTTPELERVLYVEDEADIRAVAKLALEAVGRLSVEMCASGPEAIERLGEGKGALPDLILLDVMMPEMDGPMLLRKLRAMPEVESIPVMFMTAKIQKHEVEQLRALGAVDVIAKPFDPMKLADEIRERWRRAFGDG